MQFECKEARPRFFVSIRTSAKDAKWSDEEALSQVHEATATSCVYTVHVPVGSFSNKDLGKIAADKLLPIISKCNPTHVQPAVVLGNQILDQWQHVFPEGTDHDKVIV